MDRQTQIEIEAAAFRTLRNHLMEDRKDVQNIDMMNLAGFCRNCLSRWMQEAANERGFEMTKEQARAIVICQPALRGTQQSPTQPAVSEGLVVPSCSISRARPRPRPRR